MRTQPFEAEEKIGGGLSLLPFGESGLEVGEEGGSRSEFSEECDVRLERGSRVRSREGVDQLIEICKSSLQLSISTGEGLIVKLDLPDEV